MKVGKYLAKRRGLFEQSDQKQFSMILPLYQNNGTVKVTFEKHDEEENPNQISAETCSTFQTPYGVVAAKASTDEPFSIEVTSRDLTRPIKTRVGCSLSSSGHTVVTAKAEHTTRNHSFKECVKLDMDRKTSSGINGSLKAQAVHRNYSFHFEAFTGQRMATFDAFLFNEHLCLGFNTCGSWSPRTILDTHVLCETRMLNAIVTASARYVNRRLELSVVRKWSQRLTLAGNLEACNCGHTPDYCGKIAGELAVDPNTSLRCCLSTTRDIDCGLKVRYKNCAEMEFTAFLPVGNMQDSSFGASIAFDLTKLKH